MKTSVKTGEVTSGEIKQTQDYQSVVTLAKATEGTSYRVVGIGGGCQMRMRLASMGILPGQNIMVLKANGLGPVMISSKSGKLALGRGISHNLLLALDRSA